MIIEKTNINDIETIMTIYDKARAFMRLNGNYKQWINGYPSKQQIRQDINNDVSYVVKQDNKIVATFAFIIGQDLTYIKIDEGNWSSNNNYGVIHRIASDNSIKGITNYVFNWCLQYINYLRIDTHQDNKIMQHCILKYGFKYCGIIYVNDGSPRLAYDFIKQEK